MGTPQFMETPIRIPWNVVLTSEIRVQVSMFHQATKLMHMAKEKKVTQGLLQYLVWFF